MVEIFHNRIQAPVRFGTFSTNQEQVLRHIKSPEAEFLATFTQLAQQQYRGADKVENLITAAILRLEGTQKPDFVRKMEQILQEATGTEIRTDLFEAFSKAYARVLQGLPRF